MAYIVVKDFTDLQDDNHIYRAGDKYPHRGRAKKERVAELMSHENKRGEPLIREGEA